MIEYTCMVKVFSAFSDSNQYESLSTVTTSTLVNRQAEGTIISVAFVSH